MDRPRFKPEDPVLFADSKLGAHSVQILERENGASSDPNRKIRVVFPDGSERHVMVSDLSYYDKKNPCICRFCSKNPADGKSLLMCKSCHRLLDSSNYHKTVKDVYAIGDFVKFSKYFAIITGIEESDTNPALSRYWCLHEDGDIRPRFSSELKYVWQEEPEQCTQIPFQEPPVVSPAQEISKTPAVDVGLPVNQGKSQELSKRGPPPAALSRIIQKILRQKFTDFVPVESGYVKVNISDAQITIDALSKFGHYKSVVVVPSDADYELIYEWVSLPPNPSNQKRKSPTESVQPWKEEFYRKTL